MRRKDGHAPLLDWNDLLSGLPVGVVTTAQRLSLAVEAKEPSTLGHIQRVSLLSRSLAVELGLSVERQQVVALGALLHDVGKIETPDDILLKPGPLDDAELQVMRRHAESGWRLLWERCDVRAAAVVARAHHERWDGSGYPDGLMGNRTPLEARIVGVADIYDALSSDRPYRPAWQAGDVRQELFSQRGVTLDPDCVDALFRVLGRSDIPQAP